MPPADMLVEPVQTATGLSLWISTMNLLCRMPPRDFWGVQSPLILAFLIIAFVIYFVVVVPMTRLMEHTRWQTEVAAPPAPTKEEVLLTEIRDALRQQRA